MPHLPLNIDDVIEGTIEKIVFGGDGLMRYRGLVIFIPFTAPGDLISCRITEIKKNFAMAILIEIKRASNHRVTPLCPYFGTCGGCQLQHLDDKEQLKYKLETVADTLQRMGHLKLNSVPSIVPANLKWAYRRHVTLHLKPQRGTFEAGYIATDHSSLVVVQTCPIFNEKKDPILKYLQDFVHQLPNPAAQEGRVTILKNAKQQCILFFQFPDAFHIEESQFKRALQHYPNFAGIILHTPKKQFLFGDPYSEVSIEGLNFHFTPRAFVQNHPEQSENIYRQVCSLIGTLPKKVLDLYCGFGILPLLLAKQGHQVTGIEYNPEAIKFAKENTERNRLKAHFHQGDVELLLSKVAKQVKPDLILLNPPRTGVTKGVIRTLLQIQPKEMIYISCMPATLARDLASLHQGGYEIGACLVYDMFPQTAHMETIVHLKNKHTL